MERFSIAGTAHVYGDNINTDVIIAGKYTKTLNIDKLADHVLEDLDPQFRNRVKRGDIVVGRNNFGCGSSREQAPLALKAAGVAVVIATYFARIFYRNAINVGLPLLELKDFAVETDDVLAIELSTGTVENVTKKQVYHAKPLPQVMIDILQEGGLVNYLKTVGCYQIGSNTNTER